MPCFLGVCEDKKYWRIDWPRQSVDYYCQYIYIYIYIYCASAQPYLHIDGYISIDRRQHALRVAGSRDLLYVRMDYIGDDGTFHTSKMSVGKKEGCIHYTLPDTSNYRHSIPRYVGNSGKRRISLPAGAPLQYRVHICMETPRIPDTELSQSNCNPRTARAEVLMQPA